MNNPYAPPGVRVSDLEAAGGVARYAGFWIRVGAVFIDAILISFVTTPLILWIYGLEDFLKAPTTVTEMFYRGPADILINWVLPGIAVILFWKYRQATPGKMLLSMKIVDARTLAPMGSMQAVIRWFSYFVSTLALCLGFLWVAFDPRKQAWHDKIAGTVVIRT